MSERKARTGLPWGRLAVEFVVIVIGVLLALAVDQWAESRENRALADEVLIGLGAELTDNLERRIAYHERIQPGLDSLQRLAEEGRRLRLLNSEMLPEGVGFWLLRDTGWETALVTEAVRHFDLSMTTLLSTTYSLLDALRAQEDAITDGIIRPEWFGAADQRGAVVFLAVLMRDLTSSERELRSFIRASLEAIRERVGDVPLESPMKVSVGTHAASGS